MTRRALLSLALLTGCTKREKLPYLGEVPPFTLTDQSGTTFSSDSLKKHVWVADFIYTTCPGPCPRMTSQMRAMQNRTPAQVHFVSFTVDPANDTAPVLAAYAKKFSADPSRWHFLTGEKDKLATLAREGFKLAGAGADHSTYFVLIDRRFRVRGYYGISGGSPVDKIVADAADLQKEGE